MKTAIVIAFGVAVAALIGGVTNYLAIRMLFRPRRPWHIGSWRVPFTPGLIPKRRDEIAASLGKVVSGYLVTSDALSERLASQDLADRLAKDWADQFRAWLKQEDDGLTLRDMAERWFPGGWTDDRLNGAATRLDEWFKEAFVQFWTTSGVADKPLAEWLPDWSPAKRNEWAGIFAQYAIDALARELVSPDGERLILQLTKQLVDQAGGFFGAMAALFMDEYKVAAKLRVAILEALDGVAVRHALVRFFDDQLAKAEAKSLRDLLHLAGLPADDAAEMARRAGRLMRWDAWLAKAGEWKPGPWLSEHAERIEAFLPKVADVLLKTAASQAERLFRAIRLDELVERQVRDFPVERLEEIIVNISGREFRAITWLGALLGGMIGLVQGILLHLLA